MCGRNAIASLDQLGVPVSLNLNGSRTHKTVLGGCCSIFAIILLLIVFYSEMTQVFFQLNYSGGETNEFVKYN